MTRVRSPFPDAGARRGVCRPRRGTTASTTWSSTSCARCRFRPRGWPATRCSFAARSSMRPASCRRASEVEAFVADTAPDKRARLVDGLLQAAGVRGLLDLQVVGLAAGVEPLAQPQQRPRVLRLDSRQRRGQHALGPLRLRADDGQRAHRRERRRQLLPDPPQPDRYRRELHAGVSRPHAHLRALPQPPDGEVDADRLLRVCEPLRAGRDEGRRRRQRQGRHGDDRLHGRGRHPAPAPGRGDAAAPARRRADGQPLAARIAAPTSRAG